MESCKKTPLKDLRMADLKHYDMAASRIHSWHNQIPRAINLLYDIKEAKNIFRKIKIVLKII